jgi:Fic family protein
LVSKYRHDKLRRRRDKREQDWKLSENEFVMLPNETDVFHYILQETLLQGRRCAFLSTQDISKGTGLPRSTAYNQLDKLVKMKVITLDTKHKTNFICVNMEYKRIY